MRKTEQYRNGYLLFLHKQYDIHVQKKTRKQIKHFATFLSLKKDWSNLWVLLIYLIDAVSILLFVQGLNFPVQYYRGKSLEFHKNNELSLSRNLFIRVVRNVMQLWQRRKICRQVQLLRHMYIMDSRYPQNYI